MISEKDISEYLETQDSFRFELDVFQMIRKRGFPAKHGHTYEDPKTQKDRQFDIRASWQSENGNLQIRFAIECKKLTRENPLVVSRSPRLSGESSHQVFVIRETVMGPSATRETVHNGLFKVGELVGKSATQICRNGKNELKAGDSEIYDKWTQALGSAHELIVDASMRSFQASRKKICASAVFPMLIVPEGTLWTVDYSEDGKRSKISAARSCSIFLGKQYSQPRFAVTHLLVYTKPALDGLLHELEGKERDSAFVEGVFDCFRELSNNSEPK